MLLVNVTLQPTVHNVQNIPDASRHNSVKHWCHLQSVSKLWLAWGVKIGCLLHPRNSLALSSTKMSKVNQPLSQKKTQEDDPKEFFSLRIASTVSTAYQLRDVITYNWISLILLVLNQFLFSKIVHHHNSSYYCTFLYLKIKIFVNVSRLNYPTLSISS